ncbi:hypothetical protein EDB89DRAFT_1843960 [Lactarius sanguifluus]|nr:hypothetical protein EDB89DRAFT_1843960 [Lactarius sanguifluus]
MKAGDTRSGVNNFFVNTIVTALQGSDWERLLGRTGASAMLHLLTEASIFVPLPNECLCQMTGTPLVFLPSPAIQTSGDALATSQSPGGRFKRKAKPHPEAPSPKKRLQRVLGGSK